MEDKTLTKISKARIQLSLNRKYVFYATIGMYQKLVEVQEGQDVGGRAVSTMATDGEHLYYSRKYVDKLTPDELMGVLAHEAAHCALGHHFRRVNRDPFGWNVAADFAINPMLKESGLTLPEGCLIDDQFKGMNTEAIYNKIPHTKMKMKGQFADGNFGNCGQVMDSELTAKEGADGVKRWEIITRTAAMQAKGQGYLPGDFEYLVEPIKPKLDLQSMLRHLISSAQEDDYSWARPARKHVWEGMYLPSLYTESVGEIVIAIDVSGSVGRKEVAKFTGAINMVLADFHPKKLHFLQCDAAVQKHEVIEKGEFLPEEVGIKGGGGTDMRPIWKFLEEESIVPVCTIVCSDFEMDVKSFGEEQEFPVLWVTCTPGTKSPWGLTVPLYDEA